MESQMRSASPFRHVVSAYAVLAAMTFGSASVLADPPKRPVALFVDVSEQQVPAARDLEARQFDLNGLPVLVNKGATGDVGLRAGHGIDLGAGFSIDGSASVSRGVVPTAVLSRSQGMSDMAMGGTARYQQGGWDIQLFPEIGAGKLDAGRLPNYAFGGSVARQSAGGWAIETTSRYEDRSTDTLAGNVGTAASNRFEVTRLPLFSTKLDLGYAYSWNRPAAGTATLSHGPSLGLDLDLSDALNCRVGYSYEFAGDLRGTGPSIAWLGDGGQDFTVGWDWDLAAQGIRGTTLTADFAVHEDFFTTAAPAESSGSINLGMAF